jgi:segregation and condensation protein B|tara:strand:+ start:1496 stop:2404 length:909 start_codon:yes stop_codon:yes gene_type:complete
MLKKKLEALLFSSGRKMSVEELSRLADARTGDIQQSLEELKKEYESKNSSVMIVNEGDSWKLTVHEQFLPLVQKIITETELSKTIVETLAVIAFKYPIKQSDLIRIRTNKAYDHLKELEEMGYITRQKHGRTNLIKLTQKFFEYFDLREEQLKEKFRDFASIAKSIEEKETDIKAIKQEQKARAEEGKEEEPKTEIVEEKLGDLKVVDEPSEEKLEEERERIEKTKEEDEKKLEEKEKPKFEGPGIKLSKEEEKIVDEKVEKILHPKKEEQESKEEKESEPKEEPKDLLEASAEEKEKKEEK